MKIFSFACFVFLFGTAAFSQGVDMSSLTPVLTFPEPEPADDVVTKDAVSLDK